MKNIIEDIYELTEKSILTPYNLLSNIKLPEYNEVNYKKNDKVIECTVIGATGFVATYLFDLDFSLQQASIMTDEEHFEIFNRKKQLNEVLSKFEEYDRIAEAI
ncbi:MAG: hypothetical protein RR812_01880 [Vagococcus sp.]